MCTYIWRWEKKGIEGFFGGKVSRKEMVLQGVGSMREDVNRGGVLRSLYVEWKVIVIAEKKVSRTYERRKKQKEKKQKTEIRKS